MLDLKHLRENFDAASTALARRSPEAAAALAPIRDLDARCRALQIEVDALKNHRNVASKEVGARKAKGQDASAQIAAMKEVGERIASLDAQLREAEAAREEKLLFVPNLPHTSVPDGAGAEGNREVRRWGAPAQFDFAPKPHWELGEKLGILDLPRAAKISGSGFACLRGAGARLQRALLDFMLDLHTKQHGYTEVWPPVLINAKAMTGTGQLPKFAEDMYALKDDPLWLAPTAEVPVTNLYRNEILRIDQLPIKMCAWTPCFRREAGAAGKDTRGMIRVHQFDKVELVKIVAPDQSYEEHESLVRDAEAVLQALGLCYRVMLLCAGDLGFCAAKCYDLEIWCPGVNAWLEVSSCSNFEAFQARRMNLRVKDAEGRNAMAHTLNGSGVAFARLNIALLENYQRADGGVVVPEALRPYMDGLAEIR
ncbi:MAG: serine--tRNA ligase [Verrucomicrobiae bacterium]|nr:serine--tRNA ligase [Verrucomicrobiae bacterium]